MRHDTPPSLQTAWRARLAYCDGTDRQSRCAVWEWSTAACRIRRSTSLTLVDTKNTYRTNQFHSKGQFVLRAGS